MMAIWLVVTIQLAGEPPILLTDTQQPSIEACLARASELLERAAQVRGDDGFDIAASCQLAKKPEQPAANQDHG